MTLADLHRLCATRGLGFSIDPKLRPNDSAYVTVYSAGNHSHARKSFSTEAEMLAALEQCVSEVLPPAVTDNLDDFSDPSGDEFG